MSIYRVSFARLFAVATILSFASAAQADFQVKVIVDAGTANETVNTFTAYQTVPLGGGVQFYTFNFNQNFGVGGAVKVSAEVDSFNYAGNDQAEIDISAKVTQNDATMGHTVSIVASDNAYLDPTGPLFSMSSASDATFSNTGTADQANYIGSSIFGPTPALFASSFSNDAINLNDVNHPTPTVGQNTYSGASGPNTFTSANPFGITATLTFTIGSNYLDGNNAPVIRSIQDNTSTIVIAVAPVPEPGSLALVGIGGIAALGGFLRRRKANRA